MIVKLFLSEIRMCLFCPVGGYLIVFISIIMMCILNVADLNLDCRTCIVGYFFTVQYVKEV